MTTRKAKKDHRCSLCHTTIKAGSEYKHKTIKPWDHLENEGFFEYKAHKECEAQWSDCGAYTDFMLPQDFSEWMEAFTESNGIRTSHPNRGSFNPSEDYDKMKLMKALE